MIPPKKRLCKSCGKRRSIQVYPKGKRCCNLCKDTKRIIEKKDHKESLQKTWLKRCDKIVGEKIRSKQVCESPRAHICKETWNWCHGISRAYHNTRHLEINGFCMCYAEHYYFTNHPLEWEEFLEKTWGEKKYKDLRKLALDHSRKIDFKELYEYLVV